MRASGQWQQAGQPQSTPLHLNYNANGSNQEFADKMSINGLEALAVRYPFITLHWKHDPLAPDNHQVWTQSAANQKNCPTVSLLKQALHSQSSLSGEPMSAAGHSPVEYYQSQGTQSNMNSRRKHVSVPQTNPSTSTMQSICFTQQSTAQGPVYRRIFPETSNVPSAQYNKNYPVTHMGQSTSCVNNVTGDNRNMQSRFISQINGQYSENGCTLPNKAKSISRTAVTVLTQFPPCQSLQHIQKTAVRSDPSMFNTESSQSQTCLQKHVGAAPLQTNIHSTANYLDSNTFFVKMNAVSDNGAPKDQASEMRRSGPHSKIDSVSTAQAKDGSLQASSGHATRAVAVVLPLSQESFPSKHPSPSSLTSTITASDSCSFSPSQVDKAPVQSRERFLCQTDCSCSISTDDANAQSPRPTSTFADTQDTGTRVSSLPLTFAHLLKKNGCEMVSDLQKSNLENDETMPGQMRCEKELSSVPTSLIESTDKANVQSTPLPPYPTFSNHHDAGPKICTPPLASVGFVDRNGNSKLSDFQKSDLENDKTMQCQMRCEEELSSVTTTDKENPQSTLLPPYPTSASNHDAGPRMSPSLLALDELVEGNGNSNMSDLQMKNVEKDNTTQCQKRCEEELSSVPTTQWTLRMLKEKITELESRQDERQSENTNYKYQSLMCLVRRFWSDEGKSLRTELFNGTFKQKATSMAKFCRNNDLDTVIFSQNHRDDPNRYHVLQHDEVYQDKTPYTSSWRNITFHRNTTSCKNEMNFCRSTEAESRSASEDCCRTEIQSSMPKPVELENKEDESDSLSNNNADAENGNTFGKTDPDIEKDAEENECLSDTQSNDSVYHFKIEVLPPEEAKILFQQTECTSTEMADAAVAEDKPSDLDDADRAPFQMTTLEKICCFEKWKEKMCGFSSESKCKCEAQNENTETQEHLDEEDGWRRGPIYLTEDGDNSISSQELDDNTTSSQELDDNHDKSPNASAITILSESDGECKGSENNPTEEEENEKCLVTSAESRQVWDRRKESDESSTKKRKNAYLTSSQSIHDPADVEDKGKRVARYSSDLLLCPFKKNKLSAIIKSRTIPKTHKRERSFETVELCLFGLNQKKKISGSDHQSHAQPSSEKAEVPGKVVVKIDHYKKSNTEKQEPPGNLSVKQRIHEKWRSSLPLNPIKLRRRNKQFVVVSGTPSVTVRPGPKVDGRCAASKRKMKDSDNHVKNKERKKRRKILSHSDGKDVDERQKPLDNKVKPFQDNVLKFNVLPKTFCFKGASENTELATTTIAEKESVPVSYGDSTPSIKAKGTWCDKSKSKTLPQSPSLLDSSSIFYEFQKLYKMRQASTDE